MNDKTKRMFANSTDINDEFILTSSNLKIWDMPEIVLTRDISADTIWDNFNWDEKNWDDSYSSSQVVADIINPNNTWRWLLSSMENTFWVSGSSNVLINTGTSITLSSGSSIMTNRLTMLSGSITSATLSIPEDNVTNPSYVIYKLSADDGSNFETVSLSTEHTFTNTGRYLRLYIEHNSGTSANAVISIKDTQGVRTPIQITYG